MSADPVADYFVALCEFYSEPPESAAREGARGRIDDARARADDAGVYDEISHRLLWSRDCRRRLLRLPESAP